MIETRLDQLAASLTEPLLVVQKENLFYLTGLNFIDGFLLIYPGVKGSRVSGRGRAQSPLFLGFGLEHPRGLRHASFHELKKHVEKYKTLLIEDEIPTRVFGRIKKMVTEVKCQPIASPVMQLRELKSATELEQLRQAYAVTASVFDVVKQKLKKQQWTEIGLARYIRIWGLELGADDASFEPIVAAGSNSAIPHHHPTERVIKPGEPIVLDFGFKVNGYCSDFSRTVFLKRAPLKMEQIYNHVETAYLEALQTARSGMTGRELDSVARGYLRRAKLEKHFIHALGHGTGLEVHERPFIGARGSDEPLANGMVFSIEPGVYLPKVGGVRIEDLVYLENGQAHRFVPVPTALKDNIIL